jgi:uncharacterized protein (TIGR02246 family)
MTSHQDREAVTRVVATLEHSQQNELPEQFIGLFRQDAVWTTGHGRRLFGRDAIADLTRRRWCWGTDQVAEIQPKLSAPRSTSLRTIRYPTKTAFAIGS